MAEGRNRYSFLKVEPSTVTSSQKVLSEVDGLLDKLRKMGAVRPSPSVSTAYTVVSACGDAIRKSMDIQNSTSLLNDAAVSDHTETGPGRSLS